ncbi:hypothetical protein MHF_0456 [Mycoplasma haemofelis Ohio2]|uniref:Uncharacterized protein n=1 Tax=Mycoplasma haemofelis (strain Ohio2) TaxID=859194 RepID=F6FHJ3_MYCHI|nr:hypothetical protein MHF_0456 [Mycoplasma haemofelis Ohio2]
MEVPTKLLLGLGGASAAGIGSAAGYMHFFPSESKETFKSKYELALIQDNENSIWTKKLSTLNSGTPKHPSLISAKNKNNTDSLKKACQSLYNSTFSQDLMSDFKNFCSKNYSDTIGDKKPIETATDIKTQWADFKAKNNDTLGGKLLDVHISKKSSDNEPNDWKDQVLTACKSITSSIFEGEIKGYLDICTKQ